VKYNIYSCSRVINAFIIPYITYIEPKLRVIKKQSHIFLLFFIPRENPDLADLRIYKPSENRISKCSGAASNKHFHIFHLVSF